MYLWSWRESFATGAAPLSIADLGPIEKVINTSQNDVPLTVVQFSDLIDLYGDLSTSGTPCYYYRATPSGAPEVATYPTSSDVIGVQHWRITPTISGVQEPASPDDAHYLIVDLAVRRAYNDVGAEERAQAIQSEIDRQIEGLLLNFPPGVAEGEGHIVGGYGLDW